MFKIVGWIKIKVYKEEPLKKTRELVSHINKAKY